MTAAGYASSRRPTKPRRSLTLYAGLVAFVVITLVSVSEEWGIGLDLGSIVEDIGRGWPIIQRKTRTNTAATSKTAPAMMAIIRPVDIFIPSLL